MDGDVCRRGPAPIETFTRSQLPVISSFLWLFMSSIAFQRISLDFMDFRGPSLRTDCDVCRRGPAPKETFARSKLAAISWIFMDFHDFQKNS